MKTFWELREELNEGLVSKAVGFVNAKKAHKELTKNLQATIDHHKSEHAADRKKELEYNKHDDDRATKHAQRGDTHKAMAIHAQNALNAHKKNDHENVKKHMTKYRSLTRHHVFVTGKNKNPVVGMDAHPREPDSAILVLHKTHGKD